MAKGAASSILCFLRRLRAKEALRHVPDSDLLRQFSAHRNEAAFALLVGRHGGMVLHVCQGLLRNPADADDAFQATFLVLARQARSIRKQGSLGSWLYGVAYRTALKARAAQAARRRHEARVGAAPRPDAADELTWREAQELLHQELARLPEKYRAPLVLCYLEGKRQDEAERLLGWPRGRLRSMLERARTYLRKRLVRRGLGPGAVLVTAVGLGDAVCAAPARALAAGTARAAVASATGFADAAGVVSPRVVSLAEGVLQSMTASKSKLACWGLLLVAILGIGTAKGIDGAASPADRTAAAAVPPRAPALDVRHDPTGPRREFKAVRVTARASASWKQDTTPDRAFDGDPDTCWNAGRSAPQWLEADLGASRQLAGIRLTVMQWPDGETVHEVWVSDEPIGEDRAKARLVHTFARHTQVGQILALDFPRGVCARYVQVRTTLSPSWVAWVDVELRVRPQGKPPADFSRPKE
jgi:RNA polymerase sigma factor (sigma-70 family)